MFGENYLWLLILTILVGLFYVFMIYIKSPVKSINFKTAIYYIIFGMLSISFIRIFHMTFPEWRFYINASLLTAVFVKAFFQVAFVEEMCKFLGFTIIDRFRGKIKKVTPDHPLATMFYVAMVSVSFAILENFWYETSSYGFEFKVLGIRSITSTVLHLLAGLLMGYWIALGRIKNVKKFGRTIYDHFIEKHHWVKRVLYTAAGILSATAIHGIYDFIIFLQWEHMVPGMITIALIGTLLSYGAGLHLIDEHNKMQGKKLKE